MAQNIVSLDFFKILLMIVNKVEFLNTACLQFKNPFYLASANCFYRAWALLSSHLELRSLSFYF